MGNDETGIISSNGKSAPSRYGGAEQTAAVREQTIRQIVDSKRELLKKSPVRVNLQDTDQVRTAADKYLKHCTDYGVIPSFEGLAAVLGLSRIAVYQFLSKHRETETGQFLEQLRSLFTDIRITAADRNAAPESLTIFLLKNGGEGFADRHEVEMSAQNTSNDPYRPEWAWGLSDEEYSKRLRERLEAIYLSDLPDDDGGDAE